MPRRAASNYLNWGADSNRDKLIYCQCATKDFLSQKLQLAYEREWRLLGPRGRLEIAGERLVSELYLGSRIARPHKRRILAALAPIGVPIFEMNITDYLHQWVEARI
ncbi:hypothetical protein [Bradyrhizobium sp. CCBAU 11430]|uniref:hypothetical protein n=1 Tax=Bradyrhizobium sp. CCBAU 11430 TaxID=1630881 RepID=UPI0023062D27|nr:hypothetical protein [Bradyrhizobium sp. CCBAU 11430]